MIRGLLILAAAICLFSPIVYSAEDESDQPAPPAQAGAPALAELLRIAPGGPGSRR